MLTRTERSDTRRPGPASRLAGGTRTRSAGGLSVPPEKARLATPVILFMAGLLIPWVLPIVSLNLSVYRIVLLVMIIPCFIAWAKGKAGPLRTADFAIIGYGLWCSLSFIANEGLGAATQPAGILLIESLGAYLLARIYIRTEADFRSMIMLAATGVVLLLPFALYECLTSHKPLLSIFGLVFPTLESTTMYRSGLWRVQGPFDHPIIFGLNCGSILALTYIVYRHSPGKKVMMTGAVGGTAALSLSSAPMASLVIQLGLLGWNWLLNKNSFRWYILLGFLFAGYLVVEFGSNQTPIAFYISHFTFEQQTGWYRLAIWNFGSASVAAHPFLGIGLADWARPSWMGDSVDNFWLLTAMRHGMPALLLLWLAMTSVAIGLLARKGFDETLSAYRLGIMLCLVSYLFVGSTVHLWNSAYAWFFFILGSSVWMLDVNKSESGPDGSTEPDERHRRQQRARHHERTRRPRVAGQPMRGT